MEKFSELVENLLTHIEAIQKEAYENGFENVRIFNPLKEDEQNKLNLLVKVSENCLTSLYEKVRLEYSIEKMIGCGVNIFSDYELEEDFKPQVIGETKDLTSSNSEDIIRIFAQSLKVPLIKIEGDKMELPVFKFKNQKVLQAYLNIVVPIITKQSSLESSATSRVEIFSSSQLLFNQPNAFVRLAPEKEVTKTFSEMSISSKS